VAPGPPAQAFGTTNALRIAFGIMLVASVGVLASRDVRRLEHRPPVRT